MTHKRSAIELNYCLCANLSPVSRTRLRWLHSYVKVSDGLTEFDHHDVTLIRELLQRQVWEIVFDPMNHIRKGVACTCSSQEAAVSESSSSADTFVVTSVGKTAFLFFFFCSSEHELRVSAMEKPESFSSTFTTAYDGCCAFLENHSRSSRYRTLTCGTLDYNPYHDTVCPHVTTDAHVPLNNGYTYAETHKGR